MISMKPYWILVIGFAFWMGCGGKAELPRSVVSGNVSYQGKPLIDGVIVFVPLDGTKGPLTRATIQQGSYKASVTGGVPLGKHRVEIEGYESSATVPMNRPPMMEGVPVKRQYLPERFNAKSTMEITVDAKGKTTQNFDLK